MIRRRSYRQYCGLARSLDLVGDRWSLLIVRELLPGPRRYGELSESLRGIASNLLADRLRRLEADGVLERRLIDGGAVVYTLTPWGEQLRVPIEALVMWGAPTMATGVHEEDSFDPRWMAVALPALLRHLPPDRSAELGLEIRGDLLTVRVDDGEVRVDVGPDQHPATVVVGEPDVILGLAARVLDVDHPGLTVRGDPSVVADVFGDAA